MANLCSLVYTDIEFPYDPNDTETDSSSSIGREEDEYIVVIIKK